MFHIFRLFFTVVCLVTWPLIRSEAGGYFVLAQTSLLFKCKCKCKLVSIRTAWSTYKKQRSLYQNPTSPPPPPPTTTTASRPGKDQIHQEITACGYQQTNFRACLLDKTHHVVQIGRRLSNDKSRPI